MLVLEKGARAKRVYARLIHAKLNSNGSTTQNLWNTSIEGQQTLFREFYDECGIDANTVNYVEAHSTGTRVTIYHNYQLPTANYKCTTTVTSANYILPIVYPFPTRQYVIPIYSLVPK